MSAAQDAQARLKFIKSFTGTGVIGPTALNLPACEKSLRVVVEGVGGSNTVLIKGRLRNQSTLQTLATVTGPSTGTTVDVSLQDEIQFSCGVYDPSGTPIVIASGFYY